MNKHKKSLNVNISKRLTLALDQLESVSIFDNKNCDQVKRIQKDGRTSDNIPRDLAD